MVDAAADAAELPELLKVIDDPATGFHGIIAIHSTALGPAAGGCRLWHYPDRRALTADAIRLARGMSYKNALAGLPLGGGKAVLQRPAGAFDRRALMRVLARAVEQLRGHYVTAQDVGTGVEDMQSVRLGTRHVAGLDALPGKAGGDPSPWTALGVFEAMQAAARTSLGTDLKGLTVAVQGTGNVGGRLCRMLRAAGARLILADPGDGTDALADELGARRVSAEDILSVDADILAPCSLGGILNESAIPHIKAKLICGAANNQLATPQDGARLADRGIVHAPDYVVNAGGIINLSAAYLGETQDRVRERVSAIAPRLIGILRQARQDGSPPHAVADALARRIIAGARQDFAA